MNHVESNDTAALRLAREAGWELPPEPPSPGVEAVAEVLHKHFDVRSQPWRDMHGDDRDVYREIASAALDAARAGRLDSRNAEVLAACEELERHVPIENLELPGTVKCSCGAPGAWGLYGHVQHRMHAALIALLDQLDQTEAERDQARAQVDRVRELLTKWVDEYSDPVYHGNGWAEGVRDAAREAHKELDGDR